MPSVSVTVSEPFGRASGVPDRLRARVPYPTKGMLYPDWCKYHAGP